MNTNEIIDALRTYSRPDRVKQMKTYAPSSMEMLGVSNADAKQVVNAIADVMKEDSDEALVSLASELVATNIFECQTVAWYLLEKRKKLIPSLTISEMESVRGTLDNWASVDGFGVIIYGPLWKAGTVSDADVMQLTRSENMWYRRLAVVATVPLNLRSRKGTGDAPKTIMVCDALAADHTDLIEKAISWALRSLIHWDRHAVEQFLERHENVLRYRVKKEVNHKLIHGTKN